MPLQAKICGLKKKIEVETAIKYGAAFCGFILNYPLSHRYIEDLNEIKFLENINKGTTQFVAVLVDPNNQDLEKIKNLNFHYYQIYGDQKPEEISKIKKKYKIKIIKALTVENMNDVIKYKTYEAVSDIILFDSKGYEKSMSFPHSLLKNLPKSLKKMVAGNIQTQDLEKIYKMEDISFVDVSGAVETKKKKDLNKIREFLLKVKEVNENRTI